eukprot:TRINITY_DN25029_c0_g1_i1.p1 TRINITY_DN25029_c0_g1~~TRINITY_DN25029_c0_g1_i1.p1  ORF type:complete len:222 (-),score=20.68 TRINITY_DN25029_c0_g1_i1:225-890(-)
MKKGSNNSEKRIENLLKTCESKLFKQDFPPSMAGQKEFDGLLDSLNLRINKNEFSLFTNSPNKFLLCKVLTGILGKITSNEPNWLQSSPRIYNLFKKIWDFSRLLEIKQHQLTHIKKYIEYKQVVSTIYEQGDNEQKAKLNGDDLTRVGIAFASMTGEILWADTCSCWLFEKELEDLLHTNFFELLDDFSQHFYLAKYNGNIFQGEKVKIASLQSKEESMT